MARRVMAVLGGLAMAGVLAACGPGTDAAQPSRTVPPGSIPGVTTTLGPVCTPETPLTIEAGKPTVEVPTGDAPTELVSTDLTVGDGTVAQDGDTVKMQYVGVHYTDGTEFDTSWKDGGEPFEFTLGPTAQVIAGWNQGIPGMAVGGRRQLVIPPDLAYGESGQGDIGPNETLVFVVDLVQVCRPAAATTDTTPVTDAPTGTDLGATSSTEAPGGTALPGDGESTTTTAAG